MRIKTLAIVLLAFMLVGALGAPVASGNSVVQPLDEAPECTTPLTVEDATGTNVEIEEPPEDIVVLHASVAQVMHDIDSWGMVAGAPVTPFTAYLEDHDEPNDVTDDEGFPEVEEVVALEPDLVIAGHVADHETVENLRDHGLTVYAGPPPVTVGEIKIKVETIGALVGACDAAADRTDWMTERLDDIDTMLDEQEERPMAYYELGEGWTTGDGTFQHDMIERAGADNLGAETDQAGWFEIDEEVVVDAAPDWIVHADTVEEPMVTEAVRTTAAFENERFVAVDSNLINQAGPRIVIVMETMAAAFAEDPLEETVPDDQTQEDDDQSEDREPADDRDDATVTAPADDDEDDPLPGFGPLAALGAIGALLWSIRLR